MREFVSRRAVEARWARVSAWLRERDYQALAVLQPENVEYLSGWHLDVAPWERPVAVVVPADGTPFMVLHELSTNHVRLARERGSVYIDDIVHYAERPSTGRRPWTRVEWTALIADSFERHGLGKANVAVDGPVGRLTSVSLSLPGMRFTAEPKLMRMLRTVKDAEELEFMRAAAGLTDYGQEVYKSLVKPGRLVADVDFEAVRQMRLEGAKRFPGMSLAARCVSLAGPSSASPHGTPAGSDSTFEAGHGIVNIIVVTLAGYNVENERTWFLGKPSDDQRSAFECIRRAQAAGVDRCRAGETVSAIDAAAQSVIEAEGYGEQTFHRTGHGIGLAGHEFPEDMAFNHRPLLEGEVYTIEPGIYIHGLGGFRIDDTVIVGGEPEILTHTPRDIEQQTIAT
ncbi:MAG: Xaa-Pro peptidase family protein [Deinococcales bacterium]